MLRNKVTALVALLLLLLPVGAASAHGGPTEGLYHLSAEAGPYKMILDFADWPLRAKKSNRIIIQPAGGIADKTGTLKITFADPSVKPVVTPLETYPGLHDAWMYQTAGFPKQGQMTLTIDVNGPSGKGTFTTTDLSVGEPPGIPMWVGWLIGLFPIYGLAWFGVREVRRVKRLTAKQA